MEEDSTDHFKMMIKKAGSDEVNADFTDHVMKMVQAEELLQESALRIVLSESAVEKPSRSFEMNVMLQINPAVRKAEKPIVSKSIWYVIAACYAMIMGYSLLSKSPQTGIDANPFPLEIESALTGFSLNVFQMPVLFSITIAVLGALLLADYFIHQRLAGN